MQAFITPWLLPATYLLGWLLVMVQPKHHWATARHTGRLALLLCLGAAMMVIFPFHTAKPSPDLLGLTTASLVALLGWVIIHFSSRYLTGERQQQRFVSAMLFTIACVGVLLASQHLLVITLAWSGTSIGMHFLLTHYAERKTAQIVAHKKFLVSRLAELCLIVALLLIYHACGTLQLDGLRHYLATHPDLPLSMQLAALMIVLAVILKTAQLPLHGWLIQVMEAPTPVSALLHAGIVNIGGFILIRLADLLNQAVIAQGILVLAGTTTAVLASLVMMTRVSIKVRLAWSTCAQMGFMLLEIGLGLYELALLHLLAHSLYKAHAFLSAGETVAMVRQQAYFTGGADRGWPGHYLTSGLLSGALVGASLWGWQSVFPALSVPVAALVIVALGLGPLLSGEQGWRAGLMARGAFMVLLLTQLYLGWHVLFSAIAPHSSPVNLLQTAAVILCFSGLYGLQFWLQKYPDGKLASTLYPWAYHGFYLDELFTRVTFPIWPIKLKPAQAQTRVHRFATDNGEPA
ncbi:NADH-quinone oxidoreductase subunit L [Alcanivorax sp. DP30]|uniref:NADH-quinone oxidoreductase subunit L n=1 Tax=Alcanivorax sp. DP30 TaxID=2606217 RepID=UPI00136DF7CC|nr:NADH-quinone oxidoreductase subunit L [Alcanivorax sp. DP30]MZR64397.1 NADH-quinone oxidoreductase subunit L [Alcanivorax sp. DP30]